MPELFQPWLLDLNLGGCAAALKMLSVAAIRLTFRQGSFGSCCSLEVQHSRWTDEHLGPLLLVVCVSEGNPACMGLLMQT